MQPLNAPRPQGGHPGAAQQNHQHRQCTASEYLEQASTNPAAGLVRVGALLPGVLAEIRERWDEGQAVTNAELCALAEAGDDDAFEELHCRVLDRQGEL